MQLDPAELSPSDRYQLLVATIIPRPIAWISTQGPSGLLNVAPFSYFGAVSATPPLLMVSIGRRRGAPKDTARNILATGEAVVHIPDREHAEAMVSTGAELDSEESELDLVQLALAPSTKVATPRLLDAKVALECVLHRHLEVGAGPGDMLLLEVVYCHFADEVLLSGRPDAKRLAAVGRLGGNAYCDTANPFDVVRSG